MDGGQGLRIGVGETFGRRRRLHLLRPQARNGFREGVSFLDHRAPIIGGASTKESLLVKSEDMGKAGRMGFGFPSRNHMVSYTDPR